MSSSFGQNYRISIFGESHAAAIGVTVEGLPAGSEIDVERLQSFLDRRAPGRDALSTRRREADAPEYVRLMKRMIEIMPAVGFRNHPQLRHPFQGLRESCGGAASRACRLAG